MPLFLFKEHWEIARRKIQSVFGLMCTLDVMGYSAEQFYTVPFLVLAKLLEKRTDKSDKEAERRLFHLVEETCLNIVK